MNKPFFALVAATAVGLGLASPASAVLRDFHSRGTSCQPQVPVAANVFFYDQFGVGNLNFNETRTVHCGATLPLGQISASRVIVYDRNPNPIANVECTMQLLDESGAVLGSSGRTSGAWGVASQPLSFNIPTTFTANVNLVCNIPPAHANGTSYVSSYRFTVNSP